MIGKLVTSSAKIGLWFYLVALQFVAAYDLFRSSPWIDSGVDLFLASMVALTPLGCPVAVYVAVEQWAWEPVRVALVFAPALLMLVLVVAQIKPAKAVVAWIGRPVLAPARALGVRMASRARRAYAGRAFRGACPASRLRLAMRAALQAVLAGAAVALLVIAGDWGLSATVYGGEIAQHLGRMSERLLANPVLSTLAAGGLVAVWVALALPGLAMLLALTGLALGGALALLAGLAGLLVGLAAIRAWSLWSDALPSDDPTLDRDLALLSERPLRQLIRRRAVTGYPFWVADRRRGAWFREINTHAGGVPVGAVLLGSLIGVLPAFLASVGAGVLLGHLLAMSLPAGSVSTGIAALAAALVMPGAWRRAAGKVSRPV